jgi:hypothetical protein
LCFSPFAGNRWSSQPTGKGREEESRPDPPISRHCQLWWRVEKTRCHCSFRFQKAFPTILVLFCVYL